MKWHVGENSIFLTKKITLLSICFFIFQGCQQSDTNLEFNGTSALDDKLGRKNSASLDRSRKNQSSSSSSPTLYKYSISFNGVEQVASNYVTAANLELPRHGFLSTADTSNLESSVSHIDVLMQNYLSSPMVNGDTACVKKFTNADGSIAESEECTTYSFSTALTVSAADTVINNYAAVTANVLANDTSFDVDDATGFSIGDDIMLIQMQNGDPSLSVAVAGQYERCKITNIVGTTITVSSAIRNTYEVGNSNNVNSSTVQIVSIPTYSGNVIINDGASITADPWNGETGGIVVFRATGQVIMNGSAKIEVDALGFRGGAGGVTTAGQRMGFQGEGENGIGSRTINRNGVAGGGGSGDEGPTVGAYVGASGGSYTSALEQSQGWTANLPNKAQTGDAFSFDASSDNYLLFGGGAGGGGSDNSSPHTGGDGGNGGGIIYIAANSVIQNGTSSISANGGYGTDMGAKSGSPGGVGGAGSIYIQAGSLHLNERGITARSERVLTVHAGTSWYNSCQRNSGRTYNCIGEGGTGLIKLETAYMSGSTHPTPLVIEFYDRSESYYRSCEDIKSNVPASVSGVFTIDPATDEVQSLQTVYCDMSSEGEMLAYYNANDEEYIPVSCKAKLNLSAAYNGCAGTCADGTYTIDPDAFGSYSEVDAYCDMTTDGGGWTYVAYHSAAQVTNTASIFSEKTGTYQNDLSDSANHYSLGINHFLKDTELMYLNDNSDPVVADGSNDILFLRYESVRNPFNYGPTPCFEAGYRFESKTSIAGPYTQYAVLNHCRDNKWSIYDEGASSDLLIYLQDTNAGVRFSAHGDNTYGHSGRWFIR